MDNTGMRHPSLQKNARTIAGMNRNDRRKAERLMQAGYDDERISVELNGMGARKPSALLRLWARIRDWDDPYYAHIPKAIRPMVCIGFKGGRPIMVADHIKCEKLRQKKSGT